MMKTLLQGKEVIDMEYIYGSKIDEENDVTAGFLDSICFLNGNCMINWCTVNGVCSVNNPNSP